MNQTINVWVATQINPAFSLAPFYKPILVGADHQTSEKRKKFVYLDNVGTTISNKNPKYCELTAVYWAWKNAKSDIVGLCHYRRFFLFNTKRYFRIDRLPFCDSDFELFKSVNYFTDDLLEFINKGGWIISPRKNLQTSIYNNYVSDSVCFKEDIDILIEIIVQKYPEYAKSIQEFFGAKRLNYFNMFISSWDEFNEYSTWLFDILFAVEESISFEGKTKQQKRVLGFLAERLLALYIYHNNKRIKEVLVGYYNPSHRALAIYSGNNYWLRQLIYVVLELCRSNKNILSCKFHCLFKYFQLRARL